MHWMRQVWRPFCPSIRAVTWVVGSVPVLHPDAQTVDEMLEGWRNQQLCRNLDHDTIAGRERLVERFIKHTNEFPWTWTPAMVEEFFSDLRSVKRRKQSTVSTNCKTRRVPMPAGCS
jgi:hypothetical protein